MKENTSTTTKKIIGFAKGTDGHKRITRIEDSAIVIGGNKKNHEKLTRRIIKNEQF